VIFGTVTADVRGRGYPPVRTCDVDRGHHRLVADGGTGGLWLMVAPAISAIARVPKSRSKDR